MVQVLYKAIKPQITKLILIVLGIFISILATMLAIKYPPITALNLKKNCGLSLEEIIRLRSGINPSTAAYQCLVDKFAEEKEIKKSVKLDKPFKIGSNTVTEMFIPIEATADDVRAMHMADCKVDVHIDNVANWDDYKMFLKSKGSCRGSNMYNHIADQDNDGCITDKDLTRFCKCLSGLYAPPAY